MEVYVKFPENASTVEARIIKQDGGDAHYLAQALFNPESGRWVLSWDSTQTPDGSYKIFALATMSSGQTVEGLAIPVAVVNEKVTATSAVTTNIKKTVVIVSASSSHAPIIAKNTEETIRSVTDVQKVIEEVKNKQLQKEEQIKTELIGVLNKYTENKNHGTLDFKKIVAEKSLEIHDAVLSGDKEKKQGIIMSLVSSGTSGASTNEALVKEIETHVEKLEQVADEKQNGTVDTKNFSVDVIKVTEVATSSNGVETAKKIEFSGKALPNSFATLYIYSIPILVTVKTDNEGYWSYTLDKELEDGKHHVYVGITDVKGNVVVKSSPIPFIKVAKAVTLEDIAPVIQPDETPSFVGNIYFYGSIAVILILLILLIIFIGIKRSRESSANY